MLTDALAAVSRVTTAVAAGARHSRHSLLQFAGHGTAFEGGRPKPGRDNYATWDAAYVLGSLSLSERRKFEVHLGSCTSCWRAVAELSGTAALLALLDRDDVAAIDELSSMARTVDAQDLSVPMECNASRPLAI